MEKIKRYKVIKKIHEDILSDIYRCQNGEKNNTVLIKKLKYNDEINISRFKKEFKYSQKIHSLVKNSLEPLQLLEDGKDLFFTIYDPGGDSLSNILSEKK